MKMAARFSDLAFHVVAFGADEIARPGRQRREGDPVLLVRLLHAGDLEVFQDHLGEGFFGPVLGSVLFEPVNQFVVLVHAQHAVRAEALDREGTGHADLPLVVVGLVVEVLELGLGGDRGVDLLLPGNARLPPVGVQFLCGVSGHALSASRGISHSCHCFLSAAFSFSRSGSNFACHCSQMTSISALLAMDLSVMCGTRS